MENICIYFLLEFNLPTYSISPSAHQWLLFLLVQILASSWSLKVNSLHVYCSVEWGFFYIFFFLQRESQYMKHNCSAALGEATEHGREGEETAPREGSFFPRAYPEAA